MDLLNNFENERIKKYAKDLSIIWHADKFAQLKQIVDIYSNPDSNPHFNFDHFMASNDIDDESLITTIKNVILKIFGRSSAAPRLTGGYIKKTTKYINKIIKFLSQ